MKKSIDFRQVLIYFSTSPKQDCFDFTKPPSHTSTMKTPLKFSALAGLLAASLILATHSAQAATIAYDGFNTYDTGSVIGETGGTGWSAAWNDVGGGTLQQVVDQGLSYNSGGINIDGQNRSLEITGSGVGATVVNRAFTEYTGDILYYRFLIQLNSNTLGSTDFTSLYLEDAVNGPQSGYMNSGTIFSRLRNTTAAADYVTSGTITYDETYLIVTKLEKNTPGASEDYDKISLWVNPGAGDEGSPDAVNTGVSTASIDAIDVLGFRAGAALTSADKILYDEVLVSDTWGGAIPEPTTVGLLLGAAGALILLRRRRG
jgi:hypothetical protein